MAGNVLSLGRMTDLFSSWFLGLAPFACQSLFSKNMDFSLNGNRFFVTDRSLLLPAMESRATVGISIEEDASAFCGAFFGYRSADSASCFFAWCATPRPMRGVLWDSEAALGIEQK